MTRALTAMVALLVLAGCATAPRAPKQESPLKGVERFYAMPVVFDFEEPADWELPSGQWNEKLPGFSEIFIKRLEVTKRAPISRLEGDVPEGGASIQLFVTEVDLGFFAGITAKPATLKGTLVIIDAIGVELHRSEVSFRTPRDAGHQWYTYGGRIESALDAYAVDVISLIQRERS
jgi:hypothetical protein